MDPARPMIPPADDLEATTRWLRDQQLIRQVVQRYFLGVDTPDFDLVRSCFHPDCKVDGTLEAGSLGPYLQGIEEGLTQWAATFHFCGNQYVDVRDDEGKIETWCLGWHMESDDSPIDDLMLALRYQDDVVRMGDDWKIVRRRMIKQFHRGPFPRPTIAPPSYPRS